MICSVPLISNMKRLDILSAGAAAALTMQGCAPVGDENPDALFDWEGSSADECVDHYYGQDFMQFDAEHRLSIYDGYSYSREPENGEIEGDFLLLFEMSDMEGNLIGTEECQRLVNEGVRSIVSEESDEDRFESTETEFCEGDFYQVVGPFVRPENDEFYEVYVDSFWQCEKQIQIGDGFDPAVLVIDPEGYISTVY